MKSEELWRGMTGAFSQLVGEDLLRSGFLYIFYIAIGTKETSAYPKVY